MSNAQTVKKAENATPSESPTTAQDHLVDPLTSSGKANCSHDEFTAILKDDSNFERKTWKKAQADLKKKYDFGDINNANDRLFANWKARRPGAKQEEVEEAVQQAPEERAFRFDDPNTWDFQAPKYEGVNRADIDIDMTGLVIPQHGGAKIGTPFHKHIMGGNGGVAFYYKRIGQTDKVQLVVYDIAYSRNGNAYKWEAGARSSGPPPI